MKADIGIIGGTGIYSEGMLEKPEKTSPENRYGKPSSEIIVGKFHGKRVAFLFRHGSGHTIPPHAINFRANVRAMEDMGVERIIGTAAVGSLRDDLHPGDFVFPDQLIDMGREVTTFYDGPDVRHIAFADPFCPEIRESMIRSAEEVGIKSHDKGTYLRVPGPRFSTRAESRMFRKFADIIGMTCIPEAVLARERGICYSVIAMITDYDVYKEKAVEVSDVLETMKGNSDNLERLLKVLIPNIPEKRGCDCPEAPERGKI